MSAPAQPVDAAAPEPQGSAAAAPVGSLRLAVAFLTVIPARLRGEAPPLGAAAAWFPLVGGALGALAGGVDYIALPSLGPSVAAVLGIGVLIALSGGLHQDGLADCADGLGGRGDRERRLEIMRDSSIGTFGALALLIWLLLFVSALAGLDRDAAFRGLIVAASVGRWAGLVHAATSPAARADGLGAGFVVTAGSLGLASLTAAGVTLALLGAWRGVLVLALAAIVGLGVSAWSRRSLGGRTGDTLGAAVTIAEVATVVALLAARAH